MDIDQDPNGGVWVAFGRDNGPYLIGAYPTEIEALRAAVVRCGDVMFLPWDTNLADAEQQRRTD